MRLSELAYKKLINIYDGDILGSAGDSDLLIDADSGKIIEIILPPVRGMGGQSSKKRQVAIPWTAVKKIGSEIIIIDVNDSEKHLR